jgi:phosphonate dehydrogenase
VITNWVHPEVIKFFDGKCTLVANLQRVPWSRDEVLEQARDATAIMTFMPDSVDEDFLSQCPDLKIVACALKGNDNFDVEAGSRHGVWMTIVPDLLTIPTAELAVGLLIGLARKIPQGDQFIRSGEFQGWRPKLYGAGHDGSVVGLIGGGCVGAAIAARLSGFGCSMLYNEINWLSAESEKDLAFKRASLNEIAEKSDFVISACPLTQETKHLVGAGFLAQLKPSAILVNISRGSVVDEEAVAYALEEERLAGYAVDVFEMEDWVLPDRPEIIPERLLKQMEKTLFTPHIGSAVGRVRLKIAMQAASAIVQCLEGKQPDWAVNQIQKRP